ncbi:MAG TPA: hypothetical protein PLH94_02660 [Fimbriimonadaceae bacterium]|nr:hypothetical protein [Fimbriimonadaceae bacterium]
MKRTLSLSALTLACCCAATAQVAYRMHDLGLVPGATTASTSGINNLNQLIFSGRYAYAWPSGIWAEVPRPVGYTGALGMSAINQQGFMTGFARTSGSTNANDRAALYDPINGTTIGLGLLPGGTRSNGFGLNDSNIVVGSARTSSTASSEAAALFDGTNVINLAANGFEPGNNSQARGINNAGVIVGFGRLSGQSYDQPLIFDGWGNATALGLLPDHLGGRLYDINNVGQAVGYTAMVTADTRRAVLYGAGNSTPVELERPASIDGSTIATHVNENGDAIGTGVVNGVEGRGLAWIDGTGYDLNLVTINPVPDFYIDTVSGINDSGYISGRIRNVAGDQFRAILLEPLPLIRGTITLSSYVGDPVARPVTFEISDGTNVLDAATVNLDGAGNYFFNSTVSPGAYDVFVKGSSWLRKRIGSVVVTLTGATVSTNLDYNGDLDNNNVIDSDDFDLLVGDFGGSGAGDVDGSGSTDSDDFDILIANFGLGGD